MFEEDDAVECIDCGWTGLFKETSAAPCPGGMTHRCPGCSHKGTMVETDKEIKRTQQITLGDRVQNSPEGGNRGN